MSPTALTRWHLEPDQLKHRCDPAGFSFQSTAELPEILEAVGQPRAVDAIQFGIAIRRDGYNLFALGRSGIGKHFIVRSFLDKKAATEPPADDWCYVFNFSQPQKPRALRLPPGLGPRLREDMNRLVEDMRAAIVAAFDGEEYRRRQQEIENWFAKQQEQALSDLRTKAAEFNIAVIHTPSGVGLAPLREGEVMDPATFAKLPDDERERIHEQLARFEDQLDAILRQIPKWRRESHQKLRELKQGITRAAVTVLIDEMKKTYAGIEGVQSYLAAVVEDVVENSEHFRRSKDSEETNLLTLALQQASAGPWLRRYHVNVLNDREETAGAPVVYEDNPTYHNVRGRAEYLSQMGALVTDFSLIKPGALHRANGGYLILDARRMLTEPFAWEGLKMALRAGEIRIESLAHVYSLISTASIEPEPIPLNVKVVLLGDRWLYYLLNALDPDFPELFKVGVDFEEDMPWEDASQAQFAGLLGTIARKHHLRPLDPSGVARVIEHASRLADDASKVSVALLVITDLLREADYWAGVEARAIVGATDVQRAIDAQIRREDRLRERMQEAIDRRIMLITTDGEQVGQVNGLSVITLGRFAFGRPSRITARIRMGAGKVVDIEREVELGGPIHSKGVLILAGYLAGHYVPEEPLSLSASLVFEQSYGMVEGDSASAAELYALISALSGAPIRQGLAVTGSVNQRGEIQAIGGVNEKIEGFFDVCRARGLTGTQGVLVPAANVAHLMLRDDVIEAVRAGQFHVYSVDNVEDGIEILTGTEAGRRDEAGAFPEGTVNARVEARLRAFSARAHAAVTAALAGLAAGATVPGAGDTPTSTGS